MGEIKARKLAFIGPMGSGKSSLGRRYTAKYGGAVFDTDAVFTSRYGSISAFFERYVEPEFRAIEAQLMREAALSNASVISTGGGAVLNRAGMNELRRACDIVYLSAPEEELARRIARSDRPLKNDLHDILAARAPLYERYADRRIDTSVDSLSELEKALRTPRRMRYDIALCDSDDTLLDFRKASRTSVVATAHRLKIPRADDEVVRAYTEQNCAVWRMLERGELDRDGLYAERVKRLGKALGLEIGHEFNEVYVEEMRKTRFVLDGAIEFLDRLGAAGVKAYVITNSFVIFAEERLKAISEHIDGAFVSEALGAYKPAPEFFEKVFELLGNPDKNRTIVFGDSETSDVAGAKAFGLDSCLYDPTGERATAADFSIKTYSEFFDII